MFLTDPVMGTQDKAFRVGDQDMHPRQHRRRVFGVTDENPVVIIASYAQRDI